MSSGPRIRLASWAAMILLALVLLPKVFLSDSMLYTRVLTPMVLTYIAAPVKLAFLIVAAVFAALCYRGFEPGNPARPAWLLLAVGISTYTAGQAVMAFYQLVLGTTAPFPSLADVLFVPATVILAVALTAFVVVYRRAGYPVGEWKELIGIGIFAICLLVALVWWILRPVLRASAPAPEQALNIAYPLLDGILLIPSLILLRMAIRLRGGSLWTVWMTLVVGFLFLSVGDILFAYFNTLEATLLEPLIDLSFALSYVLMARATATQHDILTGTSTFS